MYYYYYQWYSYLIWIYVHFIMFVFNAKCISVDLNQNSDYKTKKHWHTHTHTPHCLVRNGHCFATDTGLWQLNEAFLLELWRDWQDNCFTKQLKYQMIQWSYAGSLENMNTALVKSWQKASSLYKAPLYLPEFSNHNMTVPHFYLSLMVII